MMKRLLYLLVAIGFFGCDSESAPDCIQSAGEIVQVDFDVEGFKKIIVWNRVKLIISDGPEQRVVIETGDNLLDEIRVRVEDSILKVSDRNSCNFVRNYGITKVYVTSPNIEQIRNSSGETVENIGPIRWNKLELISDDRMAEDEFHIDGDFNLNALEVVQLGVIGNGLSTFRLKGRTNSVNFGIFDGDVRIEAGELISNGVFLFHRGTNKMIVNPQQVIRGVITGIGDVVAKNQPPVVDVEERFRGRLIFE